MALPFLVGDFLDLRTLEVRALLDHAGIVHDDIDMPEFGFHGVD